MDFPTAKAKAVPVVFRGGHAAQILGIIKI
jgi:hypothetical protein